MSTVYVLATIIIIIIRNGNPTPPIPHAYIDLHTYMHTRKQSSCGLHLPLHLHTVLTVKPRLENACLPACLPACRLFSEPCTYQDRALSAGRRAPVRGTAMSDAGLADPCRSFVFRRAGDCVCVRVCVYVCTCAYIRAT